MKRKKKALHRNYRFINVHPIAGALGAEIKGVNIALPLKRETRRTRIITTFFSTRDDGKTKKGYENYV